MVEQGPNRKDRSPGGGIEDLQILALAGLCARVLAEQALKLGKEIDEQIFAAELGEGALLDLAVVAIGFDDADILVDRAVGGPNFDGSEVHVVKYHDGLCRCQC